MEMDAISREHGRLETKANLQKPIDDVQKIIDQLKSARAQLEFGMSKQDAVRFCGLQTALSWDQGPNRTSS